MENRLNSLLGEVLEAWTKLGLDDKLAEISALEQESAEPDFWNDNESAQGKMRELSGLQKLVEPWQSLRGSVEDLLELSGDESLASELEAQIDEAEKQLGALKKQLLFNGEYDAGTAVLRITAGAGGDDAQDWTEMLERMYLRWAEQNGFGVRNLERTVGETAGVKTSVVEVSGPFAYGKLKSENGVHRLVRLSPFNAESRETSFARVEVLPKIEKAGEVALDDKDLKIDVYRSSGHGGQSVNTTDSAVRVTHLPTGIVVAIQNEKSQLKNKEEALSILRGKLVAMREEQHAQDIAELKGESQSAAWGQQIRNYVLHPYKLVKDVRTGYETANVDKVLDGDINQFIDAYLEYNLQT